jgi:hypothetical protein
VSAHLFTKTHEGERRGRAYRIYQCKRCGRFAKVVDGVLDLKLSDAERLDNLKDIPCEKKTPMKEILKSSSIQNREAEEELGRLIEAYSKQIVSTAESDVGEDVGEVRPIGAILFCVGVSEKGTVVREMTVAPHGTISMGTSLDEMTETPVRLFLARAIAKLATKMASGDIPVAGLKEEKEGSGTLQ